MTLKVRRQHIKNNVKCMKTEVNIFAVPCASKCPLLIVNSVLETVLVCFKYSEKNSEIMLPKVLLYQVVFKTFRTRKFPFLCHKLNSGH